ncbi:S-layer homology domain-containing protein [Candidatus Gracilibacteria bacterium]|nr:S-layer homology domain-containing protein [Candidatus Gracilibacteria bacterium]
MKKLIFVIGLLFASSALAQELRPELKVQLSPGNLPTQRVIVGAESVEILRIWLTAINHESADGVTLRKLKFQHEGDDRDHFLRYELMQENKSLGKESLSDSDFIEFGNLNIWLPDGKTTELRILADVSLGDIAGEHTFSISHPDFLTLEKNDIRDADTWVFGGFPIRANSIIVGQNFASPSPECNLREEPVCGVDGKSYYNLCIPFQKGIEILHEGSCTIQSFPKSEPCPEVFEPVCGSDGRTYSNMCELNWREGVSKLHDGSCFPKEFFRPSTFLRAVELFDLKKNELEELRPRITDKGRDRLNGISFVLHQYNFTYPPRRELIEKLSDFLEFTQNLSDRTRLEQEIELLNAAVIDARTDSAQEKYKKGNIPFLDTDEDAWFLEAVLFLKQKGWATGYISAGGEETGLFRPDQLMTKAEMTDLVFDAAGITTALSLPSQNSFATGHWAQDIIGTAERMGVSMWADFPNPEKKVDRIEALKLIFEVFEEEIPNSSHAPLFSDIGFGHPEFNAIQYAKKIGLVSGYPDGTFRPKESIIRAEAAKIVKNAYDILRKK